MENSILIAITHTGNIVAGLETTISKFVYESQVKAEIYFSNLAPIYNNRNYVVNYFQKFTKHTHLLFIDSDNIPLSNPLKMVELGLDVVGGVYPMWKGDHFEWSAMKIGQDGKYRMPPPEERNGVQEVDSIATGCMMIKREVLEAIKAPFNLILTEGGFNDLGDDYAFCKRVKEANFKVYANWDVICDHIKQVPLMTIVRAIKRAYDEGRKDLTSNDNKDRV